MWSAQDSTGTDFAEALRVRIVLIILLALTACRREIAPPATAAAPDAPRCVGEWTRAADGIEYRMHDCEIHLVRVDPKRARIDAVVSPGSTARDLGREWAFAINANFFDENFRPLGVVMSNGRMLNPAHPVSWQSVFYVDRERRPHIVPVREWKSVRNSAVTGAQCGPRLVVDGERNKVARADPDWRSGVCIDREDRVVFFATSPDARFDVTQMVEIAAGPLDCRDAMLFDGGPSTQMFLRRGDADVLVEGDKRVPAYVVVAPRSQ